MNRIVVDVETAGPFGKSLVYDLGVVVCDAQGSVVETRKWIISDVYYGMPEKMRTAYYADKLPMYDAEIAAGLREVITMANAFKEFANLCATYHVREVWAFNAKFDRDALNYTCGICSNHFVTSFFPANVKVRCIMGAAISTICNSYRYAAVAARSAAGNLRVTAEEVYRYVSGQNDFEEAHTGLEDALIEAEILFTCLRRHKRMDTEPKGVTCYSGWHALQRKFAI